MARKGQPKVRTGCLTCKIRKVKCDEAKPACTRCKSTGRLCDGYVVPDHQSRREPNAGPSQQQRQQRSRVISIAPHPPPRLHYSPSNMILTTRQSQYFDVFRYRIAPRYPDQEFWQRIVMREAVCDVCVRDSVTALGAVWQALCQEQVWRVESKGRGKLGFPSASEDHREAAKYFSRSISSFRERLARERTSMAPRSIFIATYLFFIFEQIQGNAEKADALLINGLAILRKYLSVCQQNASIESKCAAAIDDGGIAFAEGTLTRIAAINTTGLLFHAGLQDFGRQLASLIVHTPVPSPDTPLNDILAVWDVFVSRCGLWTFRTSPSQFASDPAAMNDIIGTQEHIVAKYEAWRELFLDLAHQRKNSDSIQKTLAAVWPCLRMSQMCMACFFDATELSWDDHVEECWTVLHQVEAMRAAEEEEGEAPPCETLNFVKCLYSLYVITQKCRDKEIRHQALKLLRRVTNPGVAWDIKAFAISSEVHVAAEEEGRDPKTGVIPASKRFGWTCYAWNDDRTEMVLTLRSSVSNEQGWMVQREVRVRPETFGLA